MDAFWEAYGGYIVIGMWLVIIPPILIAARIRFNKKKPKISHRGVGIVYEEGATENWQGLPEVVDALWAIATRDYSRKAHGIMKFWVRVVPNNGDVKGWLAPSTARLKALGKKGLNGTVDKVSYLGLFDKHFVMVVRQLENGKGEILGAQRSALAHEVIEHFWAFAAHGDRNWGQDADRDGGPITELGIQLLKLKKEANANAAEALKKGPQVAP